MINYICYSQKRITLILLRRYLLRPPFFVAIMENTNKPASETSKDSNTVIWVCGIIAVIAVISLWCITLYTLIGKTETARGTFGDMFGGVNALFSGLAFAGIIITILLQSKELSLQRKELHNTTIELQRTATAQENTERTLMNQQYQATFFNILGSHPQRLESLQFASKTGMDGLRAFYANLVHCVEVFERCLSQRHFTTNQTKSNPVYILNSDRASLDAYFENLTTLFRFVDTKLHDNLYYELYYNNLSNEEKFFIGIYCDCFNNDFTQQIKDCNYNFLKYYETQNIKYKLGQEAYFPNIDIIKTSQVDALIESDFIRNDSSYLISVHVANNLLNLPLDLKTIKISISQMLPDKNGFRTIFIDTQSPDTWGAKITDIDYVFNFSHDINTYLPKCSPKDQIIVELRFNFDYTGKTVLVTHNSSPIVQYSQPNRFYTV